MADRERLVLLAVASDVRGDMEDDFEVMCFGEPPSAAVCIDEVDDPWHASWNVTFRDAFFFSRDEDGKFQLRCVYNMNDYLGESEGIIQSLLGNEAEIDPEVVVVEEELPPPVETNGDDDEDCASSLKIVSTFTVRQAHLPSFYPQWGCYFCFYLLPVLVLGNFSV